MRRHGTTNPAQNLEAMVQELLGRLREAEDRLREKEEDLARLQTRTVEITQAQQATEGAEEAQGETADRAALEALDLFSSGTQPIQTRRPRPGSAARLEKLPRPARDAARQARARGEVPQTCSGCGGALRKAQCANIVAHLCLSCRGIFIEARSIRQLARTQSWFRDVERFLNTSPRSSKAPPSTRTWPR